MTSGKKETCGHIPSIVLCMHGHVVANGVCGENQKSVIFPFSECLNLTLSWGCSIFSLGRGAILSVYVYIVSHSALAQTTCYSELKTRIYLKNKQTKNPGVIVFA